MVGVPLPRVAHKSRPALHDLDRQWLTASPPCLVATAAADGSCDVSPKGDPAGYPAYVLYDTTVVLAERPGNRRADGYRNILENPHVGLDFFIPGRGDTLRINGRARLTREPDLLDRMLVRGHRPLLAMVVEVEVVFHHCAKAFLRSGLWQPETWDPEGRVPRRALIAKQVEAAGMDVEQLDDYYRPENYRRGLYA